MAPKISRRALAEEEYRTQRENGTLRLLKVRSFTPKAGTTVNHYSWVSSNGLQALVVETIHRKAIPSRAIINWSEA